jgi:hypothetical protein
VVIKTEEIELADQVVQALTHGPTPAVQDWEIEESGYDPFGASAIIKVNGHSFLVRVTMFADGE